MRAPTAPSIPMQNQAFGYEEGPAGQLVKQRAPVETYTGAKGDIPGPGNYDPSISYTRPNVKGSDFGRSRAERSTIKVMRFESHAKDMDLGFRVWGLGFK